MEYILSNIISQSKYNHKRVNSYTERIELKLRWCPDGCLVNNDLSNMAELPSFSPPASESTLQHRTSPLRQARMRRKLKAAPVYI